MTRRRPTINHWVTAPVESVAPALYRLPKRGATLEHHLWWIQDRLASFGKPRVVQPELAIETEEEAPPAAPALRGRFETPEPDARVRRQDDTFVLSAVDDADEGDRRFPPGFVFVEEPFIPSPPPVLAPVAISIPVPSREETIDALLRASPELLAAARLLLNAETAGAGLFADHARGAVERALKKVELPPMLSSAAAAPAIVDVAASQTEDDGLARARSVLDSGEPPINSLKARVAVTYDYTPGQEPYLVSLTSRTLPLFGDHDATKIQVDAEALVTDGADNFLFDPDGTSGSELTVSAEPADDIDEIIGRIRLFTASLEEDETPAAAVAAVVEEPALDLTQVAEAPLLPGDPLAEGERDDDDARWDAFGAAAADFDLGQPTEDLNIAEMVALGVPLPAIEEDETAPKRKRGFTILRNASAYLKRCQRRARDMVTAFNDPLAKVVDRVNGAVVMAHARSLTGPVDSEAAPVADTPRRKRARISLPSPLRRRLRMAGAAVKNFEKSTKAIRLAASLVMLSAASSSAPIIAPPLDPEQPTISDAGEARLLASHVEEEEIDIYNGPQVVIHHELTADADAQYQFFSYLRDRHNVPVLMAAAMTGNFMHESRLDTTAENPNDGATGRLSYGIAQWQLGRLERLYAFAAREGETRDLTNRFLQADFAMCEMGLAAADIQCGFEPTHNYAGVGMMNATTLEEANRYMTVYYESPRGSNHGYQHAWGVEHRYDYAAAMLDRYEAEGGQELERGTRVRFVRYVPPSRRNQEQITPEDNAQPSVLLASLDLSPQPFDQLVTIDGSIATDPLAGLNGPMAGLADTGTLVSDALGTPDTGATTVVTPPRPEDGAVPGATATTAEPTLEPGTIY